MLSRAIRQAEPVAILRPNLFCRVLVGYRLAVLINTGNSPVRALGRQACVNPVCCLVHNPNVSLLNLSERNYNLLSGLCDCASNQEALAISRHAVANPEPRKFHHVAGILRPGNPAA
jgi:hypothetical protein